MGSLFSGSGFNINPSVIPYMGSSTSVSTYTPGTTVTNTALSNLTSAIRLGFTKISTITTNTYNNLISIGQSSIPALGNSKPTTYTKTLTSEQASYGFLRNIPLQAYNEFHVNNGSYSDFVSTFNTCYHSRAHFNETIKSLNNSKTFLENAYSNMNDLITADIAGVSLSTFYWGQDLIASGRAIDLKTIDTFGNPDNLLKTLDKNRAITRTVNLALLSAGMNATDIDNIINGGIVTDDQQKLIYGAFSLVMGEDLADVLIPLNCQTPGLDSLADLLDIKKLFPNSYTTLTYPQYNAIELPTNSKTYFLIFSGGTVNLNGTDIGARLSNIIPVDIAFSADAFSITMMQIRNIQTVNIEKFSQVVMHLENVSNVGVGGTNIPTNTSMADTALTAVAKGSGTDGLYTMCDYFGSMTDLHYDWKELQDSIQSLQTSTLVSIYTSIYNLLASTGPYTNLQTLIDQANAEIASIKTANLAKANLLNAQYNTFGTHLLKEQNARSLALPGLADLTSNETDIISFMDSFDQYAVETETAGPALVLESIANTTVTGGNYLISAMREARNAKRLGLAGIELDNDVNGTAPEALPRITKTTLNDSPIDGYSNSSSLANTPIITGAATTPGSLGGSPETMLVPNNLSILVEPAAATVLTPDEAINEVVLCNCDCWDNLE